MTNLTCSASKDKNHLTKTFKLSKAIHKPHASNKGSLRIPLRPDNWTTFILFIDHMYASMPILMRVWINLPCFWFSPLLPLAITPINFCKLCEEAILVTNGQNSGAHLGLWAMALLPFVAVAVVLFPLLASGVCAKGVVVMEAVRQTLAVSELTPVIFACTRRLRIDKAEWDKVSGNDQERGKG